MKYVPPIYEPTPEMIAEECERIQATRQTGGKWNRGREPKEKRWSVQVVSTAMLRDEIQEKPEW